MIAECICAAAAIYAALRTVLEKRTLMKLTYLNVLGFAVSGAIVLILPHPLTLGAAAAFFVGSTLESNAVASVYSLKGDEDDEVTA